MSKRGKVLVRDVGAGAAKIGNSMLQAPVTKIVKFTFIYCLLKSKVNHNVTLEGLDKNPLI
jgi:hypothetical protein